jgi:hypothetical protein
VWHQTVTCRCGWAGVAHIDDAACSVSSGAQGDYCIGKCDALQYTVQYRLSTGYWWALESCFLSIGTPDGVQQLTAGALCPSPADMSSPSTSSHPMPHHSSQVQVRSALLWRLKPPELPIADSPLLDLIAVALSPGVPRAYPWRVHQKLAGVVSGDAMTSFNGWDGPLPQLQALPISATHPTL